MHQVFGGKNTDKTTGRREKKEEQQQLKQLKQAQLCTSTLKTSFCWTPETHFAWAGGDVCSAFLVLSVFRKA